MEEISSGNKKRQAFVSYVKRKFEPISVIGSILAAIVFIHTENTRINERMDKQIEQSNKRADDCNKRSDELHKEFYDLLKEMRK